jgi:hypothetical protein
MPLQPSLVMPWYQRTHTYTQYSYLDRYCGTHTHTHTHVNTRMINTRTHTLHFTLFLRSSLLVIKCKCCVQCVGKHTRVCVHMFVCVCDYVSNNSRCEINSVSSSLVGHRLPPVYRVSWRRLICGSPDARRPYVGVQSPFGCACMCLHVCAFTQHTCLILTHTITVGACVRVCVSVDRTPFKTAPCTHQPSNRYSR